MPVTKLFVLLVSESYSREETFSSAGFARMANTGKERRACTEAGPPPSGCTLAHKSTESLEAETNPERTSPPASREAKLHSADTLPLCLPSGVGAR